MNLRKMSLKQLDELSAKIDARKARLQKEQAGTVRKQIMDTLRTAGLSVADLFGAGATAAAKVGRGPGRPKGSKNAAAPKAAAAAKAPAAKSAAPAAKSAAPAGKSAAAPAKGRKRRARRKAVAARKGADKPGARAQKGVTYANPSDSKQRWSGYGKRPGWFLSAIAAGKTEADLRAK